MWSPLHFLVGIFVLLLSGLVPSPTTVLALNATQIAALQQFYTATGGPQWSNSEGWNAPIEVWGDPCAEHDPQPPKLYGVACAIFEITTFELNSNNLKGSIPSNFFALFPAMIVVNVGQNIGLIGNIPEFSPESRLTQFLAGSCGFSGTLPASIFVPTLTLVDVSINQLSGGLPQQVVNCTLLTSLNVGQNKLSIGTFPDITGCSGLTSINAIGCGVTSMPANMNLLQNLAQLNLEANSLSGTIPSSWCSLTKLNLLHLTNNHQINGEIPCTTDWVNMKELLIVNTQMTGSIPTTLFTSMTGLTVLGLSGSKFSGQVPDMFDNLPNIENVLLNGNGLKGQPTYSGTFPSTLFKSSLLVLSLQYTEMTGTLPPIDPAQNIQSISIASNPTLSMAFPTILFTSYWHSEETSATKGPRATMIANMDLTGEIPFVSGELLQLDSGGGFGFTNTHLTGYIPNSTLNWVPVSSQNKLLSGCHKLLYPVKPWMYHLTDNFQGLQFQLNSVAATVTAFSMDGGEAVGAVASNYITTVQNAQYFHCGFCIATDTTLCAADLNAMSPPQRTAVFLFMAATLNTAGDTMQCTTPPVTVVSALLYIVFIGPAYDQFVTEYYQVSSGGLQLSFYNPRPVVQRVYPSEGRLEGCTMLTLIGAGFLNNPTPIMTLSEPNSAQAEVVVHGGTVLNDTAVTFLLPSANTSNVNIKYQFSLMTSLQPNYYAAGNFNIQSNTQGVSYMFRDTCVGPLIPCANGLTDPDQCPTPLCRCFSMGHCVGNASVPYTCDCLGAFTGSMCHMCLPDYYGASCDRCECVNGLCKSGIDNDGSCSCDNGFIGATCAISKLGLGVGLGVGGGVLIGGIIFIVLFIRKRKHAADEQMHLIS